MRIGSVLCLSVPLLALTIAPRDVEACSPLFCRAWKSLTIAHSTPIPADGVIVIAAEFGDGTIAEETDLAALYVEVSGEGGELYNGTLELSAAPLAIIWRPDEPLMPGLEYDVLVTADNLVFGDEAYCADDSVFTEGVVTTAVPGLPETAAPPVSAEEELFEQMSADLDDLICCDGAFPFLEMCSGEASWTEGHCASTAAHGLVSLKMTLDGDAYAAMGGQIGVEGWVPGELTHDVTFADDGCYAINAVNFATGEVVEGESICLSAEAVASFGKKDVDPTAELEGACVGQPYTCEVMGEVWSEEACMDWPPDGGTTTGTDTDSDGSASSSGETSSTSNSDGGTSVTDSATTDGDTTTGDTDASASTGGGLDDGGGCACDVAGGSPAGLAWLTLALPMFWRRRRS
ncbi:MAG: MYXO-CTERM sorting domain-containing protein [Nannocystaceae bacterium]